MKKLSFLIIALVSIFSLSAQDRGVGCTIDSANTEFFNPRPDTLPCVERNTSYNQIIQILVPTSINLQDLVPSLPFPFVLTIDSVIIDSVTGFPNGISYFMNPWDGRLYGGSRGCALITGTTSDPVGNYPIAFHGTMTLHGAAFPPYFDGDTTISFDALQSAPQNPFSASLDVINPGDQCRAANGINNFSADLNAAISVYPNPNNGVFNLKLNAAHRLNGSIVVMDATGRKAFEQSIDVVGLYQTTIDLKTLAKGIYTVKLQTAEGVASRIISIE